MTSYFLQTHSPWMCSDLIQCVHLMSSTVTCRENPNTQWLWSDNGLCEIWLHFLLYWIFFMMESFIQTSTFNCAIHSPHGQLFRLLLHNNYEAVVWKHLFYFFKKCFSHMCRSMYLKHQSFLTAQQFLHKVLGTFSTAVQPQETGEKSPPWICPLKTTPPPSSQSRHNIWAQKHTSGDSQFWCEDPMMHTLLTGFFFF